MGRLRLNLSKKEMKLIAAEFLSYSMFQMKLLCSRYFEPHTFIAFGGPNVETSRYIAVKII